MCCMQQKLARHAKGQQTELEEIATETETRFKCNRHVETGIGQGCLNSLDKEFKRSTINILKALMEK